MSKNIWALLVTAAFLSGCTQQNRLQTLDEVLVAKTPQFVTVQIQNYTPVTGRAFKDFYVSNFSVKASRGKLQWSTSRDGLSDDFKNAHQSDYAFVPNGPDSTGNGFSDLIKYLAGVPLAQQNTMFCGANLHLSQSNEAFIYNDKRLAGAPQTLLGLRDCEKLYLGLDPSKFDFDGDGIPDYLELRCGLNPKNANDSRLSPAADGMSNLEKCKRNIPIDENSNSQPNTLYAYNYKTSQSKDGSRSFTVSNIPILNEGQDNFIALYLTEVDLSNNKPYLYTAYMILQHGAAGKTFRSSFWGADPTKTNNQEIVSP